MAVFAMKDKSESGTFGLEKAKNACF